MTSQLCRIAIASMVIALALETDSCRAESLPAYGLRRLAMASDQIVVAKPDPKSTTAVPTQYTVVSTLKGPLNPGMRITVDDWRNTVMGPFVGRQEKRRYRIHEALLFLGKRIVKGEQKGKYAVVLSGMRCRTPEGHVLIPFQWTNPGSYHLIRPTELGKEDLKWKKVIRRVQTDLTLVKSALALKRIPPGMRRSAAIFAWIDKHMQSLASYRTASYEWDFPYDNLDREVLRWVAAGGDPNDCWKAVCAAAKYDVEPPLNAVGAFRTPAGRKLLTTELKTEKLDEKLTAYATLFLGASTDNIEVCEFLLDRAENAKLSVAKRVAALTAVARSDVNGEPREMILTRVPNLLKAQEPAIRARAVEGLWRASVMQGSKRKPIKINTTVALLREMYTTERHPEVRIEVGYALSRIKGAEYWERVSGNPFGIVGKALPRNVDWKGFAVFLQLLATTNVKLERTPTIVFDRVDAKGKIIESNTIAPSVSGDPGTSAWLTIPYSKLKPGTYRYRVYGHVVHAGKTRKWKSERVTVEITGTSWRLATPHSPAK